VSPSSSPYSPVYGVKGNGTSAAAASGKWAPSSTTVSPAKFTGAAGKNAISIAALAGAVAVIALF